MTSASAQRALLIHVTLPTTFSIGVSASIHRIGERIVDGRVRRGGPTDLAIRAGSRGEAKTLGAEPEPDLARRSQFRELREPGANGADHRFIGMKANFAVRFSPHKTHRQTAPEFPACRLIADASLESCPQDVQFGFGHNTFQAQDQAIVKKRRMIDAVAITDQSVSHAAQIEQAIPVSMVARHAGDFQSQHDAHTAQGNFGRHARESRTLGPSRTGETQIFINDDYLVFGPTQLIRFVDQRILASGGLPVVLDLRWSGLANIDNGSALGMTGFDFSEITHDSSPRSGCRASER